MTDKQIIDDCIHLDEWKHCDICEKLIKTKDGANGKKREHLLTEEDLRCDFYPNCYYKQLQAKEQECEELNEELYYWVNGEYCDNECNVVKELDQLKAENDLFRTCHDNEQAKRRKLEQTLTEIKEICNNNDELKGDFNLVDCDKYKLGKHNLANRILQKISECEGNDGN